MAENFQTWSLHNTFHLKCFYLHHPQRHLDPVRWKPRYYDFYFTDEETEVQRCLGDLTEVTYELVTDRSLKHIFWLQIQSCFCNTTIAARQFLTLRCHPVFIRGPPAGQSLDGRELGISWSSCHLALLWLRRVPSSKCVKLPFSQ